MRCTDWPHLRRQALIAIVAFSLAGCTNPYGLNINTLNLELEQKHGVIQFTDPKLFTREHLINERQRELSFLAVSLAECNKTDVKSELIRELEVVQSISAGIKTTVDPAAGENFERQREIAEIRQEIAKTRTDMQLAQVRRDAELLGERLAAQEEVNTPSLPDELNAQDVTSAIKAPTTADLDALLAKVESMANTLRTSSSTAHQPLKKSGGEVGPIDKFNYRKTCRDTVNNAINRTQLDELHDKDGNTLVRVQFRATALPGPQEYSDTLGILRMEVIPPNLSSSESRQSVNVYRTWLKYVNQNINSPPRLSESLEEQRIRTTPRFVDFPIHGYFDLRYIELPKYDDGGLIVNEEAEDCSGLRLSERSPENCWYLRVALPTGTADSRDIWYHAQDILVEELYGAARGIQAKHVPSSGPCGLGNLDDITRFPQLNDSRKMGKTTRQAVTTASRVLQHRRSWRSYAADIPFSLRDSLGVVFANTELDHKELAKAARAVLNAVRMERKECNFEKFVVPESFLKVINDSGKRVAAYEVGPAERVQPVSTAVRAADAFAMAAAATGSIPTYGLGQSGSFAFLRSAMGRANALELAPIVVGFSEPVNLNEEGEAAAPVLSPQQNDSGDIPQFHGETPASFGWLLGPKAVLDPENQELKFVHPIRPYDLYVDLSLPGWWPEFQLRAYTAWAPNWRDNQYVGATMNTSKESLIRTVKVPMRHNRADMEGLTTLLAQAADLPSLDAPRIEEVVPSQIFACDGQIDLQIRGHNVWRASMVHLGGQASNSISSANDSANANMPKAEPEIRILPDMSGIVAKLTFAKRDIDGYGESVLTVWTPDGRDSWPIRIVESSAQGGTDCKKANLVIPPGSKQPVIVALRPARVSACAGTISLNVLGKHLSSHARIDVGGVLASNVIALPSRSGLSFDIDVNEIPVVKDEAVVVNVSTKGGDVSAMLGFTDARSGGVGAESTCVGLQKPRGPTIAALYPKKISACAGTTSFQLFGQNLMAHPQVHIAGVMATSVETLPSGQGLSFQLNVDDVPVVGRQPVMVIVSTEGGDVAEEIYFSDIRRSSGSEQATCVAVTEAMRPAIDSISPNSVNVCRESISFRALGSNLANATDARIGGVTASIPVELQPHDGTLIRFDFDLNRNRGDLDGLSDAVAEVRTEHGLATAIVTLTGNVAKCSTKN